MGRWCFGFGKISQAQQTTLPTIDRRTQSDIVAQASPDLGALLCRKRTQYIFTGELVKFLRGFIHRSSGHPMHSRKAIRLRLIQALTVPSGVPSLCEICAWE
ncbi:hypothetical protein D3C73_1293680 [compost metagenome]